MKFGYNSHDFKQFYPVIKLNGQKEEMNFRPYNLSIELGYGYVFIVTIYKIYTL